MDTRASTSTLTRLSVIPILIALLLNMLVPVLTAAVPDLAPAALQPQVTEAVEPNHVSFTLEGCKDPSVNLELTNFVCADADYTTGNLGKSWNELDLVPHRITTELGSQADATETYDVAIVADRFDAGAPGYDIISVPVLNTALSDDSCQLVAYTGGDLPGGVGQTVSPGLGGIDTSLYRILTINQDKGTTCVFDYYQRLALGSHLFPGSSLHSNLANEELGTAGIGSKEVSIPVKEILPQELDKTMTAEVGQAYGWSIEKSADPASLDFANTCLETAGARSQDVDITVTWTRSGPTASGATTITTVVTATNPAHRVITVQATDKIYEGAGQTTLLDQVTGAAVDVDAGSSEIVLTHTFVYNGSATTFNDVATATYTDKVTGVAVPGATSATASASATPAAGTPANASVTITDTESITGTGLSFSVAAPSVGAFTGGYVAGTETTGPVGWQTTATNSGSVTFTKTVMVDEPRITSGTLSDTATIVGDGQVELDSDSESVEITTDALVELSISKSIPAGSLRNGESVTFTFDVTGPGGFSDTASITFNFGDPLTKSTSLQDLAPGEYTVSEQPQANWADHVDQVETITLPDCEGSVSFNNTTLAPDLSITKEADADPVNAGDDIGFSIVVSNDDEAGTGVAKDVTLSDPLPGSTALGVDWTLDAVLLNDVAVADPSAYCEITGSAPAETLSCDFGDLAAGDSYEVQVSSSTSADDGCQTTTLPNTATAQASNHDEIEASDSITVECPDLDIEKTADAGTVSAGEDLGFTITVSNGDAAGTGTATNVTLNDPLPGSTALGVDWSVDTVWLNGVEVGDPAAYCEITGSAPAQTLECEFGDLEPGDSAAVHVTSGTSAPDGCLNADLENTATADADNHEEIDASATIAVECPVLSLEKAADADLVSVGEDIGFTITVSNGGGDDVGTATNVTITDPLPGSTALGVDWSVDGVWLNGAPVGDPSEYCDITGSAPTQTLECDFGDLAPGDSAAVHVTSSTSDEGDCTTADLVNEATADADNHAEITASDSIVVQCPGLNMVKTADADPIDAGEEASFTITVWNAGPGDAFDVVLHDDLPVGPSWDFEIVSGDATVDDCSIASSLVLGGESQMSIDCEFGTLEASDMADGIVIRIFADTTREDCGVLLNEAWADASNDDRVEDDATIQVKCPTIELDKENDAVGSVLPGTGVTYTLTLTVSDGPAEDVMVVDALPVGLENPTNISDGGVYDAVEHTITWDLGDLADGEYTLTYEATVADDVENGEELVNAAAATSTNSQCPDLETLGPECEDDSTVIVRVPTLVIDKVADAEVITISGPNDDLVADPSIVTWTLTWTLTDGPVTNAVITDEIPAGFEFLDASDGGTLVDGVVTWNFATLTENGSVTFRTTVDPETISRVAPTVNVAVIDSDETEPDEGEDSVTVVVEPPPLGGTPTPRPSLPNTASGFGTDGTPVTIPVELLVAFFLASLGALTLANAKARSRRS